MRPTVETDAPFVQRNHAFPINTHTRPLTQARPGPRPPQGGAESLTGHYILLLGLYRLFYILNWIYRYATEPHYMQLIVWGARPAPRTSAGPRLQHTTTTTQPSASVFSQSPARCRRRSTSTFSTRT